MKRGSQPYQLYVTLTYTLTLATDLSTFLLNLSKLGIHGYQDMQNLRLTYNIHLSKMMLHVFALQKINKQNKIIKNIFI